MDDLSPIDVNSHRTVIRDVNLLSVGTHLDLNEKKGDEARETQKLKQIVSDEEIEKEKQKEEESVNEREIEIVKKEKLDENSESASHMHTFFALEQVTEESLQTRIASLHEENTNESKVPASPDIVSVFPPSDSHSASSSAPLTSPLLFPTLPDQSSSLSPPSSSASSSYQSPLSPPIILKNPSFSSPPLKPPPLSSPSHSAMLRDLHSLIRIQFLTLLDSPCASYDTSSLSF